MDKAGTNEPLFSGYLIHGESMNYRKGLWLKKVTILFFFLIFSCMGFGAYAKDNSHNNNPDKKGIEMTSFAFGGTGLLLSNVKDQFTVMTGGRGSATFNNRFTFGGGGWGMLKGIEVESSDADVYQFFKFGYGGLEFGYVLYPGEKLRMGSNLLLGYGAGFNETVPKSENGDFKMFPVLEPSVYLQVSLGKYLKLDVGLTYRYVARSNFSYIHSYEISGFSFYMALLTTSCRCN